jgi:hypothetical protein
MPPGPGLLISIIAAFAIVWPAAKLSVEVSGRVVCELG